MSTEKQSDNTVRLFAGASLVIGIILSVFGTIIGIVDWPLARKIIFGVLLIIGLLFLEIVLWNRKRKRISVKKLPWLLDLIVDIQRELDAESKRIFRDEIILQTLRLALISIIATIIFAAGINLSETKLSSIINPPTFTLTSSLTPTLTPSSTVTLTPSPKPLSESLYYMIVYDSSIKMEEDFHGQRKWEVARNLLVEIINGLNPRAQYSLVTVGGSNPSDGSDPCGNPTSLALPFSSKAIAYNYLGSLRPQGGGSFYKAYTLAKNQLEDLSKDTIRTLIYVTGSSDSCDTEDEWTALKNLISFPDSTFGIFSQIIILDDDGIESKTLADQFNSLSNNNINAQAPQSISEIQSGGVTVVHIVNNVTTYITNIIAALPTNTPTKTLTPTITTTLKPGETPVVLPTSIPTNTPTFPPTLTKTFTPSPVPPTISICPPASHVFLAGPSYGGSVSINSPGHCSIGQPLETAIYTSGSYSNIPEGTIIWVLAYAPDNLYYPQSPNACAGAPPPNQGGGGWNVNTYLGLPGDPPRWYDLVVVLTDQNASEYLTNWLIAGCSGGFPGIDPAVLSSMNITEKVYITVQTQ